jgi:hypothetical protein
MAIRLRQVERRWVALCAEKTEPKEGDLYLDDNMHHALKVKFGLDFYSEGLMKDSLVDDILVELTRRTESNGE